MLNLNMNFRDQLPRKRINQTTIKLTNFDSPLLKKPITFEVFSTKGNLKSRGDYDGECFKFYDELPCVGAIWYRRGYFEAMVHECIHLAHHVLALKLIRVPWTMKEDYPNMSTEEKICQLSGAISSAIYYEHFLKYP